MKTKLVWQERGYYREVPIHGQLINVWDDLQSFAQRIDKAVYSLFPWYAKILSMIKTQRVWKFLMRASNIEIRYTTEFETQHKSFWYSENHNDAHVVIYKDATKPSYKKITIRLNEFTQTPEGDS